MAGDKPKHVSASDTYTAVLLIRNKQWLFRQHCPHLKIIVIVLKLFSAHKVLITYTE